MLTEEVLVEELHKTRVDEETTAVGSVIAMCMIHGLQRLNPPAKSIGYTNHQQTLLALQIKRAVDSETDCLT